MESKCRKSVESATKSGEQFSNMVRWSCSFVKEEPQNVLQMKVICVIEETYLRVVIHLSGKSCAVPTTNQIETKTAKQE